MMYLKKPKSDSAFFNADIRQLFLVILLLGITSLQAFSQHLAQNYNLRRKSAFTENKGQVTDQNGVVRKDVKYLYSAPGLKLVLKSNSLSYEVITLEKKRNSKQTFSEATGINSSLPFPDKFKEPEEVTIHSHRIDVNFIGANPNPEIIAEERSSGYNNYYLAHTPEEGVTNVYAYSKLTYKNIYPAIDLVFYAREEGKLKYDIIVHPGGKLKDVKMKYNGMNRLALANGTLKIQTAQGAVEEEIPYSFLQENKKEVKVKYVLKDEEISFNGYYDRSKTLVIDPELVWGTYYGGSDREDGYNICTDDSYNVYVTGKTYSTSGIASTGAYQTIHGGGFSDIFIAKFTSVGQRQWGTYYGGSREDDLGGIAIDKFGNISITGRTYSTSGIATIGAHQAVHGDSGKTYDAFIAKFNNSGVRQWGTYVGGSSYDEGYALCIDSIGDIYITGRTASNYGIATQGAYQTSITNLGNDHDAFIVKFNSNGVRQWGTYFGGTSADDGEGIAIDPNGNIFITGRTYSTSGIATSGTHKDKKNKQWDFDAFVAKFNTNGKRLWGTYFGGDDFDFGYGTCVDNYGNVYITGYTHSSSEIASSGAHQPILGGNSDAFIAKFSANGKRVWSTYYGGKEMDRAWGIATNKSGNIYIIGTTFSTLGISTPGSHKINIAGLFDAFVACFNSNGARVWGTYYGGTREDNGYDISADDSGNLFITGNTHSPTGLSTSDVHQELFGGSIDAFVAKFRDIYCDMTISFKGDTSICTKSIESYFTDNINNSTYYWSINNGTIISGQGTNKIDVLWHNEDSGSVKVVVSSNDDCKDSVIKSIKINPLPLAQAGSNRTICTGASAVIGSEEIAGNTYSWSSNPAGFTSNQANPKVRPVENTTYYLTETNPTTGCTKTDSVKITVSPYPSPQPFVIGDTAHCLKSVSLFSSTSSAGSNKLWKITSGEIITGQGTDTVTVKWLNPGKGAVKITETTTFGCTDSSEITVIINPLPDADFTFSGICIGTPTIFSVTETPGVIFLWDFGDGKTSNLAASQHQFTDTGNYYVKLKVQNSSGCVDSSSKIIKIYPTPEAFAGTNKTVCHGETTKIGVEAFDDHSYSWTSIPAGFTSSQADPVVAPTVTTTYYLTVENNFSGCKNSDSVTITVRSKLADAITGLENVCVSSESDYSLEINSINNNYQWYVTNGQIVSGQNTEKVKIRWNDKAGDGTVKAVLTDTVTGCKDSVLFSVKINNPPVVNWVSTKISDKTFRFEPSDKSFLSYNWDFGDGNSSSEVSPVHTFGNYSMYQVKLTVKTGAGCEVTKESILGALINSLIVSPNPASKEATIKFTLARDMNIKIGMYDVRGREVLNITEGLHSQGIYEQKLDATLLGLSAGVYVIRMLAGEDVITKRLILLK